MFADVKTPAERDIRAALWMIIIVLSAFRVWLVFHYNPLDHVWSDPQRHLEQGIDVLRDDPVSLMDPVGFQIYIAALAKLTLKIPVLVAFYTSVLSLLTPWLWYRFMREALPSRTLALVGWALLAWLPSWSYIYSYFMQETLLLPLLGASLWATWRTRRKGTTGAFILALALWSATGLTRAICLPLAGIAMAWVWFEQPQRIVRAVAGALFLAAVFVPLSIRSMERAHIIAPYGIGAVTYLYAHSGAQEIQLRFEREGAKWEYGFGSPSTGIAPFEPLSDWHSQREGIVTFFINLDRGPLDWDAAKATQTYGPGHYLWLTGENLIFLFFGESWPDSDSSTAIGILNHHLRWVWAPLTLLVAVGTLVLWRRRRDALLPALMLTWFIFQGLTLVSVNEGRYRKPFEGLLIVQTLAVAGLLAQRKADKRSLAADKAPDKVTNKVSS